MNSLRPLPPLLALPLLTLPCFADLQINEVRVDNGGSDLDVEYVELLNTGAEAIDLSGYTYVVLGDDGSGSSGVIENITELTGTVPAGGYFVIADTGDGSLTGVDYEDDGTVDLAVTPDLVIGLNFENSDNTTHLLVQGFSGANADDLDTDDDGTLDTMPWTTLVDAVGFVESPTIPPTATEYVYAASLGFTDVGPDGNFLPGHVYRSGDGEVWAIGPFGTGGFETGVIASSSVPIVDSPGITNPVAATGTLQLSLSESSVSESAGFGVSTLTVTRTGSLDGEVTVSVSIDDSSEATLQGIEVLIFDGEASGTIDIDAVDDLWPDGDQMVTVTAAAANYGSSDILLTVTDDPGEAFSLVVAEAYNWTSATGSDANGDGTSDNSDEFVEILNLSGSPIDLGGYSISENGAQERGAVHTFPEGTILAPGAAIVVFGGGTPPLGSSAAFGTAEVRLADFGNLTLTDSGDFITLRDPSENEIHRVDLPDQSTLGDSSLTLAIDSTPGSGYIAHTSTTPATAYSPGTKIDGSPYVEITDSLSLTVNVATVVEDGDPVSAAITVSTPANVTEDTVVRINSSDVGELIAEDTVTIAAGTSSADVSILPIDDSSVDGDQLVTVTASASGYLNASGSITVQDDGNDIPVFTDLVINEIDADTPGSDVAEFIELYNKTGEVQPLNGLVLVLYNGNGDQVYQTIDLSGEEIPANGFFVIGNAAVENVDLVISDGSIQNGADGVALYIGSVEDYPSGQALSASTGTLVDALVYDTDDNDDLELLAALTPSSIQVNEGGGAGGSASDALARRPDGGEAFDSEAFVAQAPTPGVTNMTSGDAFDSWASLNGLSAGVNDGPEDDVEFGTTGDGIANVLEFILDGDPLAADTSILPAVSVDGSDFIFTFSRREDSVGVATATFHWSTDLSFPMSNDVVIGQSSAPADGNGVVVDIDESATPDMVTIRVPRTNAPDGRIFGRLEGTRP